MPKCPWHFVKHLVCMASFDMFLSLHCDLAPRIILACPLGFQLLLTWVCYLPASTATSSMLWHFVEHTQCVHWTRPERAYCSHAAEPTRWPPRLWPALQNLAKQPPPRPAGQALAAAAARQPCAVQRRPSLAYSPPGPWSSASSSAGVSASPRRRHVALATECRFAGRPYPPPRNRPRRAINGHPEPL